MKIALTTSYYPPYHLGGDALHVYHLAQALAHDGHEVHIVTQRDPFTLKRGSPMPGDFPNHPNVTVHSIATNHALWGVGVTLAFGRHGAYIDEAFAILDRIQADIVHHHEIAGFGSAILRYPAKRSLWTMHDYWLICPTSNLRRFNGKLCDVDFNCETCTFLAKRPPQVWRRWESTGHIAERIDLVLAPSTYLGDRVEKHTGLPFATLYNFVPDTPPREEVVPWERRRHEILFVGMLEEHKGIRWLIEKFRASDLDVKLRIIGGGSLESYVRAAAQADPRIVYDGRVSAAALREAQASAKAFVFASQWPENCPLVLLEAMSFGTPVLSAPMGGVPELLGYADGDYLDFAAADPWKAARVLLEDRGSWVATSTMLRERFDDRFTKERFLARYYALLAQAPGQAPPA